MLYISIYMHVYVYENAIHTICNPFKYFGYLPLSCVCCSCSFDQRCRHILFEAREAHRPLGAPMVTLTPPWPPGPREDPWGIARSAHVGRNTKKVNTEPLT